MVCLEEEEENANTDFNFPLKFSYLEFPKEIWDWVIKNELTLEFTLSSIEQKELKNILQLSLLRKMSNADGSTLHHTM